MSMWNFVENIGKKIFGDNSSDLEKRTHIHNEINSLNLPAHISVEVSGNKVTLEGNAADLVTKEKIILAVGNLLGVENIEDKIIIPQDVITQHSEFIIVKNGDTLWRIAENIYGDGSKYTVIYEANKPMLKSADEIFVGQKLRIPLFQAV